MAHHHPVAPARIASSPRPASGAGASPRRRCRPVALASATILVLALTARSVLAQAAATTPPAAFSLSSSQVFTTKATPTIFVTFRGVQHLDFRVYRVSDAEQFFLGLKDAHVLGSPEPVVAEEPTWIERISAWKARQRESLRDFLRGQFSARYRRARSAELERSRLAQRRVVKDYRQFAQLPLLNPKQLVTAWRELLPRTRDAEARRIPMEVTGPGVYLVEAVNDQQRAFTVVIVTDVGLVTKAAPGQVVSWAVHRMTGEPRADCNLSAIVNRERVSAAVTGGDGVATLALPEADAPSLITIGRCGTETIVADPGGFYLRDSSAELVGYIYPDRPVYRPGDTVNVKGILRWRERGLLRPFDRAQVELSISDTTDKVVFRATRSVDPFGAIEATFTLPGGAALGYYAIRIASEDKEATGSFEVQEYRKPEFEVAVTPPTRFVLQGRQARFAFAARYFFGQPVAGARVHYVVHRGYYFSPYRWVDQPDSDTSTEPALYAGDQIGEGDTQLDPSGVASVMVPLPRDDELRRDLTIRVEARVRDASGREASGNATMVATWARMLLAIGTDRYVHRPGSTAAVRVRAIDYQGTPQPGTRVTFVLERLTYEEGRYESPSVEQLTTGSGTCDAEGRATWQVTVPKDPGDYRIRAETHTDDRVVSADVSMFVPGPENTFYDEGDRTFELVADRASYQPGDTAKLVLRGEPVTAPVLVTKEREQTSWHRVVTVGGDGVVEVPIEDDDVGDVWVNVAFVRDDRLNRAERRLSVPPTRRALNVAVEPASIVAHPRDPATITLRVTDGDGRPVRAQLSVGVVDEALYAVKPDLTPDPVRFFHRRTYSRVGTQFSRDYSFVGFSGREVLQLAQRRRPFSLADFKGERPVRPEVRREFPDAIYWSATLVTDDAGAAKVTLTYPDALTTWRITARAITADTKAGASVARTTVTKDVILRLATPRFLTQGDALDLPVIAHNYHAEPRTIDVGVTATGLSLKSSAGEPLRVEVPPSGARDARWSFVADRAGKVLVDGSATTVDDGDRVQVSFPVLPYGLRREIGASGSSRAAGEFHAKLDIPAASNPAERVVDVAVTPTLAGSLLGALDFLTTYPYGCTEQILSGFLPNLLVMRTLDRLEIAPTERLQAVEKMSAGGVRKLLEMQHDSGGWGWWPTDQDHPFMTAYALYGLVEGDRAGLPVNRMKLQQAATATARLYTQYPRAIPDLKAYLAWSLAVANTRDIKPDLGDDGWSASKVHDELWAARDRMGPYGRALLALTLLAANDSRADQEVASLVGLAQTRGELAWWSSDRDPLLGEDVDTTVEATALAVRAIAARQPDHPTVERAVRWLLANRTSGAYWGTTKQTAMALFGLLALVEARGEHPTTFSVDVMVNGVAAGTHTFTPESWTAAEPVVIRAVARPGANDVSIVQRGAGPLYWSATARYYDTREPLERTGSRTLALKREYFALAPVSTNGRIVYRTSPFSGAARPGDVILVHLTAAGSTDWRYLVLDDPIPAGTEAVQDPQLYELEHPITWWSASHREYRDSRVVQFQESFERGRYDYYYLLKAVTPGAFRAMPAQIAPMYIPGVSATTTTQAVSIGAPGPSSATSARER